MIACERLRGFALVCALLAVLQAPAGFGPGAHAADARPGPVPVPVARPDRTPITNDDALAARQAYRDVSRHDQAAALDMASALLMRLEVSRGIDQLVEARVLGDAARYAANLRRYDRAVDLAQAARTRLREARRSESVPFAIASHTLGTALSAEGRMRQATPHLQEAHRLFARLLGPDSPHTLRLAVDLAAHLRQLLETDTARDVLTGALADYEASGAAADAGVAAAYRELAQLALAQDRFGEAEAAVDRSLAVLDNLGDTSTGNRAALDMARVRALLIRAELLVSWSRFPEADAALDAVSATLEPMPEPPADLAANVIYTRAAIRLAQGSLAEAEALLKRANRLYLATIGDRHPGRARLLHQLALVYAELRLHNLAQDAFHSAIDIFETNGGRDSIEAASTRVEYALWLRDIGEPTRARAEALRALSVLQQDGDKWALRRAYGHSAAAFAAWDLGNLADAEAAFQQAFALMRSVAGETALELIPGYLALGEIMLNTGRASEALQIVTAAEDIAHRARANGISGLPQALALRARIANTLGERQAARDASRMATEILAARFELLGEDLSFASRRERYVSREIFTGFLSVAAPRSGGGRAVTLEAAEANDLARAAQWAVESETSVAVRQMAERLAARDTAAGSLMRRRQDTVQDWQAAERALSEAIAGGAAGGRADIERLQTAVDRHKAAIEHLDAELVGTSDVDLRLLEGVVRDLIDVRTALADGEGLFFHVTSDAETYAFLVTPSDIQFAVTPLSAAVLADAVTRVRAGLDFDTLNIETALAFDVAAAHELYRGFFAPFAASIAELEHLNVVPDRAAQSLPFSVLVSAPATATPTDLVDFRTVPFLVDALALSVQPSVSAFLALRIAARPSTAGTPFLGIGNPVLAGEDETLSVAPLETEYSDSGGIRPETLNRLAPLPETERELRTISQTLGDNSRVILAADATERHVKRQPLADYRIVAFATHALIAGEFEGLAEPGIVLTPDTTAVQTGDEGLLTASEIVDLRLDADWVILSACNTAQSYGEYAAHGVSGLARAFVLAGARALLVSHWAVETNSAVALTTGTMAVLADRPGIGRSRALREAMLALRHSDANPFYAHPIFWAPFVVIGEGHANDL